MSGAEGGAEVTAKSALCGGWDETAAAPDGAAAAVYIVIPRKDYRISQVRRNGYAHLASREDRRNHELI